MNATAWPIRTHQEIGPGDIGTLGATVPWMRQLVVEGRSDPLVRERAKAIVAGAADPIEAIFRHVQSMPYKYDEDILASRGLGSDTSELLQGAPFQVQRELTLGRESVEGDCDDRAILTQSLLESLGYKTRFVLVRGPKRDDFSHVYSEVQVGDRWLPLDTIMNGVDGRAFYAPGDEVGAREGARDRVSVAVDLGSGSLLWPLALAVFMLWRRR